MALTVAELAAAIRLTADATTPPPEPQLSILHRQLRVAQSTIGSYASNAPEEVQDEAAVRMVGYQYDAPPADRFATQQIFRFSGAMSLLSLWHIPGSATVGAGTAATTPTVSAPETSINPSHPVHTGTHYRYAGWSDNGTIDQAELDAAARSLHGRRADGAEPGNQWLLLLWRGRNPRLSRFHSA